MTNLNNDDGFLSGPEKTRIKRRDKRRKTAMVVDNAGLVKQQIALRNKALDRKAKQKSDINN